MSHFTVLVIGEDPESQLAPFQENNCDDCPKEYLEFEDQEDEFKEQWKSGTTKAVKMPDGTYALPWDERFRVPGQFGTGTGTHKIPEGLKEEPVPFKKLYKSFKKFCAEWHGHKSRDEETGRYGYWNNPNSKWDWFQIGGRWEGMFMLKPGAIGQQGERSPLALLENEPRIPDNHVSQAKKGDIDWDTMYRAQAFQLEKKWEEAHNKDKVTQSFMYGIGKDMTKEDYMNNNMGFHTFAILKDGHWYEQGDMGWWGIVSNEKEAKDWAKQCRELLESLPDDTLLTIVDCHV